MSEDQRTQARRESDRQSDQPSQLKSIAIVLTVVLGFATLGGLVWNAGASWNGFQEAAKTNEKFREEYVRKDVLAEQFRAMNQSIEELKRQIEDMRFEQREARKKP